MSTLPDVPPLLRARQARKLELDDLVAGLVEKLGLTTDATAKVRRHYQELELGRLDPAGVAASVWVALAVLLGRDAKGLARVPPPAPAPPAVSRAADFDAYMYEPLMTAEPVEHEPDEVDRLFGVDPSD